MSFNLFVKENGRTTGESTIRSANLLITYFVNILKRKDVTGATVRIDLTVEEREDTSRMKSERKRIRRPAK